MRSGVRFVDVASLEHFLVAFETEIVLEDFLGQGNDVQLNKTESEQISSPIIASSTDPRTTYLLERFVQSLSFNIILLFDLFLITSSQVII